jgi:hypothetical protein
MFPDELKILNIWADAQGHSHFRHTKVALAPFVAAGGVVSASVKATNAWFRIAPGDQDVGFHVAPRRQLVITLRGGAAEFTTSDGDSRIVRPGEILLVEDTFGHGHKTRTVDGLERFGIYVELAPGDLEQPQEA